MGAIAVPLPIGGPSVLSTLRGKLRGIRAVFAGLSDYAEKKVLDHITGKATFTSPSLYLALCTVAVTDADTGSTITEATYTGYARLAAGSSNWGSASGTSATATTTSALTFAACTGGSSTIIGWCLTDSATTGAGNSIMFGTCTSTTVSTTQTPANVAAGALTLGLD